MATSPGLIARCSRFLGTVLGRRAESDDSRVLRGTAVRQSDGRFRFDLTVRALHEDPSHYCDAVEVLAPDGQRLRTLALRPGSAGSESSTYELEDVSVPPLTAFVLVRARHSWRGYDNRNLRIELPQ
jgi:hypothetical protein